MTRQLHVLTVPPDEFTQTLLEALKKSPTVELTVADLTGANPDYARLVEQIFASDSIASW
ncbi:MAG: hypothetical protein U1G08_07310 [Verrucomicrobiota bacterium]